MYHRRRSLQLSTQGSARPYFRLYTSSLYVLLLASILPGCAPRDSYTTTGAIAGTAVGAGAGAAIGSASGNVGTGAAVGAAVGALSGAAIGDVRDDAEGATKQQDAFIRRQEEERKKQERELQDLRRQKYHDEYLKARYPQIAQ
jgi:hypothetical protein